MKDKSYEENLKLEQELLNQGYQNIACVDEVGRGCFAGPLVCAAVIMKPNVRIPFLTDSKKIPKKRHQELLKEIKKNVIAWNLSVIDVETIDRINILQATLLGMKEAIEGLKIKPDFALIDGDKEVKLEIPQKTVVSGDFYSHGISAASLVAKTYRDKLMAEYDEEFGSVYDWASNAGYPTPKHIELTREHGVTKYHRKSWKTINKL